MLSDIIWKREGRNDSWSDQNTPGAQVSCQASVWVHGEGYCYFTGFRVQIWGKESMQGHMGKAEALGLLVGLKKTGQTNLVLPKYFTHHSYSSLSA